MEKPKTTPKDFFLYLSAFATLYVSAISLIGLLFAIVNRVFPDTLSGYYGDLYSGGMRFAIASLVVVFPIYLFLASYINRHLRAHPEKRELGVRKWLSYVTLFLTGAAVVTDLVVLLNYFLGGEITARFAFKVLSVLVVAGAVFWYHLYDLRKTFASDMPDRSRLIVSLACVLVFGSIIGGFALVGSPMKARDLRFDDRRVSDLTSVQWQIVNFWQQKGELPASLDGLNDAISGYAVPVDPQTGEAYSYQKTGDLSFRLCAEFALSSDESLSGRRESSIAYPSGFDSRNANWSHEAGEHCFDRTIDPDLYPPRDALTEKALVAPRPL